MKESTEFDIDKTIYRNAMSKLAAAVNVITTDGPYGKAGFTATAVCSVTDSPATLLVCLQHKSSAYEAVKGNKVLCVNTLNGHLDFVSNKFGGKTPMNERFDGNQWKTLITGAPVLTTATLAFDCIIDQVLTVETHDVLFCKVQAIHQSDTESTCLIYAGRSYQSIPV